LNLTNELVSYLLAHAKPIFADIPLNWKYFCFYELLKIGVSSQDVKTLAVEDVLLGSLSRLHAGLRSYQDEDLGDVWEGPHDLLEDNLPHETGTTCHKQCLATIELCDAHKN
jgi:hypothetical protein